jgi:hypothetical protein
MTRAEGIKEEAMSLGGLLLGIINIAIVVVVLLLIGALIEMFMSWMGWPISAMVRKLYIGAVALVALYMLVSLLLGLPTLRIIHG